MSGELDHVTTLAMQLCVARFDTSVSGATFIGLIGDLVSKCVDEALEDAAAAKPAQPDAPPPVPPEPPQIIRDPEVARLAAMIVDSAADKVPAAPAASQNTIAPSKEGAGVATGAAGAPRERRARRPNMTPAERAALTERVTAAVIKAGDGQLPYGFAGRTATEFKCSKARIKNEIAEVRAVRGRSQTKPIAAPTPPEKSGGAGTPAVSVSSGPPASQTVAKPDVRPPPPPKPALPYIAKREPVAPRAASAAPVVRRRDPGDAPDAPPPRRGNLTADEKAEVCRRYVEAKPEGAARRAWAVERATELGVTVDTIYNALAPVMGTPAPSTTKPHPSLQPSTRRVTTNPRTREVGGGYGSGG